MKRLREQDAINILDWIVGVDSYFRAQGVRVRCWRLTRDQRRELASLMRTPDLTQVLGTPIVERAS